MLRDSELTEESDDELVEAEESDDELVEAELTEEFELIDSDDLDESELSDVSD